METLEKQKFGVFFKALCAETSKLQYAFVQEFFMTFDVKIAASDAQNYVKNWISGKNQSYKKQFKSVNCNSQNYENAFRYLEENINIRFKNVQNRLRSNRSEYSHIDFETNDSNVFFTSIINQFTELVDLPLPPIQEDVLRNDPPCKQMSRIFGQAVADHNIAIHICQLGHYLNAGALCPEDLPAFFDTIKTKILSKFVNHQDEAIFQKIIEFSEELKNYFGLLSMLPYGCDSDGNSDMESTILHPFWAVPSYSTEFISETEIRFELPDFGSCWEMNRSYDEVYSLIETERRRLKENTPWSNYLSSTDDKLIRLDFIASIFTSHKRLCVLFEEISDGKKLQIY